MHTPPTPPRPAAIGAVTLIFFAVALTLRIQGITTRFWLLEDQMRDWWIALQPFSELPLVGPPTHVGGYTIGPAFYWILWAVRVSLGPWFDNLPHAGGIGHAVLQSGADALLVAAIWRRTGSPWPALIAGALLVTSAYDLALAALVWNPVMGSVLAKTAIALVLLDWHRQSLFRAGLTALVAWAAVHAYTGAIYVAVSVFIAIIADPFLRGDRTQARRNLAIAVLATALLQLPYLAYRFSSQFRAEAMGAVSGSVGRILTGEAAPEITKSLTGYVGAVRFIEFAPWNAPLVGWGLLACGIVVAVRYRDDAPLLAMTLLPQLLAVAGYSLFLASLDHYYYLSVMPAAATTITIALWAVTPRRVATAIGAALLIGTLAAAPAKYRLSTTFHRMPQYGLLVEASRKIKGQGQPMRSIRTEFALPPTTDPEYLFKVLGGRIDRESPWASVITADGDVRYVQIK